MKKVFIISNLGSLGDKDIVRANLYCRMAWEQGFFPISSTANIYNFIPYETTEQRKRALKLAAELMSECEEVWIFGEALNGISIAQYRMAHQQRKIIREFDRYGTPM